MAEKKLPLKFHIMKKMYQAKHAWKNATQKFSKGDSTMAGLDFTGKKAIIFGVATDTSIAWHIAKKLNDAGCQIALGYQERAKDFVEPLLKQLKDPIAIPADATDEESMDKFYNDIKEKWGSVDIMVHSIAFAKKEHLQGRFIDVDRRGWNVSQEVSAFSFADFVKRTEPLMSKGGSILTLTFGYNRVFPNYNMMGVAKSALETAVRYAANDVGEKGIRVNAISAGPVKTMAASGITGFDTMLEHFEKRSPLRRCIEQDEVAKAALFLLSDLSSAVTGEIMNVDAGYSVMGI